MREEERKRGEPDVREIGKSEEQSPEAKVRSDGTEASFSVGKYAIYRSNTILGSKRRVKKQS